MNNLDNDITRKRTRKELFAKGSLIAIIISIPSLSAFFTAWVLLENLIEAAISGLAVHFIVMGFVLKIAKKNPGYKILGSLPSLE